jgi:hypothetical protein
MMHLPKAVTLFVNTANVAVALLVLLPATYAADLERGHAELFGRAASPLDLEKLRQPVGQQINSVVVDGTVRNDTVSSGITGSNLITNGSFTIGNGLTTAIQNAGSNTLIQNTSRPTLDLR